MNPAIVRAKWRPTLAMVIGGVLTVVLTLPLAGMAAVVLLTGSPQAVFVRILNNLGLIAVAGLVIAAATAIVGLLFWRLVARPVAGLVAWTGQQPSPGATPPEASYGTREFALLAESFGAMVIRLHERSDYIAAYTAHVSHELKSPLAAIAGAAEIMREAGDGMDAATRDKFLDNIGRDALRLSALLARMRELARAEMDRPTGHSLVPDLVARLAGRFPGLEIVADEAAEPLPLPEEDALLLLGHLADNAVSHRAGTMRVGTRRELGRTVLTVTNDGEPVSPGNRDRIFEPFFTTRRESGGTGMGLAIVRALLTAHGGRIELADIDAPAGSKGVAFRVVLPDRVR